VAPGGGPEFESLTFTEARARVLATVAPLAPERIAVERCAGRALREDAIAPHDLPPFANSSMDGWAVRAADLARASGAAPVVLRVAAVIPAGAPPARVEAGTAARIMTGAPLPDGADAVVPFEDGERLGDGGGERARIARPSRPGENVRNAGRDVTRGERVLETGRELTPHDLALLVAIGRAEVEVGPRPRVALLSTGDELLPPGAPLVPGAIRDSNLPMLAALAEEAGGRVVRAERCRDAPPTVAAAIASSLVEADVVLTIGGVSAGDFDPVKGALDAVGGVALWRVAMKPGRPQAFGTPAGRVLFGLPGNPASVACVFEALVRPALRRLQGFASLERPRLTARAAVAIDSRAGRTDFVRVTLERRDDGWWATPAGDQVSGHLSPQSRADGLMILGDDVAALAAGAAAEVMVWRWPAGAHA
jgi:molybdopterin molybdotransferase